MLFFNDANHSATSKLINGTEQKRYNYANLVNIKTNTLDNVLKKSNIKITDIDFIKIDVEGAERTVLEGSHETLNSLKTGTKICVEISKDKINETLSLFKDYRFGVKERIKCNFLLEKLK